jgi:hypothetical protein
VGYESWLERDRLILLDFDAGTVGIASQPFWLFWATAEGKPPVARAGLLRPASDGSALVLDFRPVDRVKPRDREAFEVTRMT